MQWFLEGGDMKIKKIFIVVILSVFFYTGLIVAQGIAQEGAEIVKLPEPSKEGGLSVSEAIYNRRSTRNFSDKALTLREVSQVLWASSGITVDGITGPTRAYPSAGAVYAFDVYVVAGNVESLNPGIYNYDWKVHALTLIKKGDFRVPLAKVCRGQRMIEEAPMIIVLAASEEKVESRYGERGVTKYISMDAGHLGQNVHLMSESLGLGTVMVGAYTEKGVADILGLTDEVPEYIMPVGWPE